MFIKVTDREAARIGANRGHIWDGIGPLAGCIVELNDPPRHYRKARRLRALTRKLAGPWKYEDSWYIYKPDPS